MQSIAWDILDTHYVVGLDLIACFDKLWYCYWHIIFNRQLLIMRSRVRFPALPWEFFLVGKIPTVTMVWVVSRLRLKGPSWYLIFIYISPLSSMGQRSRTSWAHQPQKSATLSPQPGGKTTKFIRTGGGIRYRYIKWHNSQLLHEIRDSDWWCHERNLIHSQSHSTCDYVVVSLDNEQLDAHLLYFTIRPLQSSTCFEHYILIIRM